MDQYNVTSKIFRLEGVKSLWYIISNWSNTKFLTDLLEIFKFVYCYNWIDS